MTPLSEIALVEQQCARFHGLIADRVSALSAATETLVGLFGELIREAERAGRPEIASLVAEQITNRLRSVAGEAIIRHMEAVNG